MTPLTKEQIEFRTFVALSPLASLSVVPNSISQPAPPAPDIYCEIVGLGPLAVELVAIDDDETRTRLNHMFNTKEAWGRALSRWPPREQLQVQANAADVFLSLNFDNGARMQEHVQALIAVQHLLLDVPGFTGDVPLDRFGTIRGLNAAKVFRGNVKDGPQLSAPSGGYWLPPQADKLVEKLRDKKYETRAPLELFAYATHDEPDGAVGSLEAIQGAVTAHLPGSLFRRVHLFHRGFLRHIWSSD
jgi:hypothetical protein